MKIKKKKPIIQNLKRPNETKITSTKIKHGFQDRFPSPEITGQYKTYHKIKELIESRGIKLKK